VSIFYRGFRAVRAATIEKGTALFLVVFFLMAVSDVATGELTQHKYVTNTVFALVFLVIVWNWIKPGK
jgi:hypothetical protein